MAKKKRDFWDDVDEDVEISGKHPKHMSSYDEEDTEVPEEVDPDDKFHLTRCLPFKLVTRILLFVAAAVIGVSGYICYKYVDDRYDGGYTNSYFSSKGFSEQYNDAVENVLKIVEQVELNPSYADSQDSMDALVSTFFDDESNFSFYVQDADKNYLFASGDDAKERIETSYHHLSLSTVDNNFSVDSSTDSIPSKGLNQEAWKTQMDSLSNTYIIYTAVDNNLTEGGDFYDSYMEYQSNTQSFNYARIALIAAGVLFIVLLVLCVISTGMRNGYSDVKLSWFDHIYTEFAAIFCIALLAAILYGIWYVHRFGITESYDNYIMIGGLALFYIALVRSYFSLVRRIKSGHFVLDSLIYKLGHQINKGLNHLPKVLKGIIVVIFLLALNAGLVYALLYLRDFSVRGIPLVFVIVPLIFIIELIAFICCLFGGVPEAEDEDTYASEDEEAQAEVSDAHESSVGDIDPDDWSNVDFGKGVKGIEPAAEPEIDAGSLGVTQQNVIIPTAGKTVMLSEEEVNAIRQNDPVQAVTSQQEIAAQTATVQDIYQQSTAKDAAASSPSIILPETAAAVGAASTAGAAAGAAAASSATQVLDTDAVNQALVQDETLLDFIQLNKDVRKMFRLKLKAKSLGVTLRAPEKPILLDIDKSNAIKVLSILFDNVEKYAQEGTRVYIEMYTQKGKMVYMMKNTIREDMIGEVSGEMGDSLKQAKRIVQSEGGKFITTVDGNVFKAGILLSTAN